MIVIVGAGAAGLAAAATLARAGEEFTVLEARSRVGGRVWTLRHEATPLPIELGAEFVHGEASETERLALAAGSLICDVAGDQWRARGGRLTRLDHFWDSVGRVLGRLDGGRGGGDRSFGDFLRSRPGGRSLAPARTLARSFVQGFHAADVDLISTRSLAAGGVPGDDESASRHGRLVTGYSPLLQHLAAASADRIRFGACVERVAWRAGGATLHLHGGATLEASAVIVTVPLPLLQSGALRLEPEPRALRRALDQLVIGSVVRVTLLFDDRFWEDGAGATLPRDASLAGLSFLHTPAGPFNIWWTAHPLRAPVIVGWSGGPPARELARAGDVDAAAIRSLAAAFGMAARALERRVRATFVHDWDADPYSRGAYSYAAVGGSAAGARLSRPLAGTLFLAGEATAGRDSGTVDGALASGRRAARQLLRAARRG